MPGKCHFFLEKKRRHCKFDAVPGKAYCGNHLYEGEGVGPKRVPCPWDPKGGHTVLESELERHKNKCPGYLQRLAQQEQPCFAEDINAGPGLEVEWPAGLQPLPAPAQLTQHTSGADAAADAGATDGSSIRKRQRRQRPAQGASLVQAAYAAAMGEQRFMQLLQRVETACEQVRRARQPARGDHHGAACLPACLPAGILTQPGLSCPPSFVPARPHPSTPAPPAPPQAGVRGRAAVAGSAARGGALSGPRVGDLQPPLLPQARAAAGVHRGQHEAAGAAGWGRWGCLCRVRRRQGVLEVSGGRRPGGPGAGWLAWDRLTAQPAARPPELRAQARPG